MSSRDSNQTNGYRPDKRILFTLLIAGTVQLFFLSVTVLLAFAYSVMIIARPTFRQNKLNWFTVNICMQTVFFCIFVGLSVVQQRVDPSGGLPCRIQGFAFDMTIGQVLYSHSVAAFCRLLAIVWATKHLFRSTGFTLACMGFSWMIPVLMACPYLFLNGYTCGTQDRRGFLSYYTLVVTILLPMGIVAVCNCRLLWFVRRSTRQVHTGTDRNRAPHARDIQLMKTLVSTFVIVVIGWGPIFILQIMIGEVSIPWALDLCIQMLPSVSMLLDVCLLIYTNQPVRLYLKQYICRRSQIAPSITTLDIQPKVRM